MVVTTSALVLALVITGAIPDKQASGPFCPASTVTAEAIGTDLLWLDGESRLAVRPAPGYLESEAWQRWQQHRSTSENQRKGTNA